MSTCNTVKLVILMVMFAWGAKIYIEAYRPPSDAAEYWVTGKQWMWSFHYPEEKLDTSEMVVPVGMPVKVELTAPKDDVVHSFYIPDFRVKEDCIPGQDTYLWFEADRIGLYHILCAEFCGKDHSKMLAILKVVSDEDYDLWVEAERAKRFQPLVYEAFVDPQHETFGDEGLRIDAESIFLTFCASCHGAAGDGSGLPGIARDFKTATKWKRSPKAVDIFRTLTEGVADTQMRAYPNISPWERVALAHHVRAFMTDPGPDATAEDYAALVEEYELDKIQPPGKTIPVEQAMEILSREGTGGDEP